MIMLWVIFLKKQNKVDEYELVLYNVLMSLNNSYLRKDKKLEKMVNKILSYIDEKNDDGIKKDIVDSELIEVITYKD